MFGIAIWGYLPVTITNRALPRRVALGLLMGWGAIGSMLVPVQVESGLILDFRYPLLAAAGFVGGPLSAAIAAALALLYRLHLGGMGMWVGCYAIIIMAALGATTHLAVRGRGWNMQALPLLAAAVSGGWLLMVFLFLPPSTWHSVLENAGAIALLTSGGRGCFRCRCFAISVCGISSKGTASTGQSSKRCRTA